MNKYVVFMILLVVPCISWAYTPTSEDADWLTMTEDTFTALFPENVDQLVRIYDALDKKKVEMRIAGGDRGLYLWQEMKDILHEQLFTQSDVCTALHAQVGDTVEVTYDVRDMSGKLLRSIEKPLAFNPGKGQVWTALEQSVLGMQAQQVLRKTIKTSGVIPGDDGTEKRTVSTDTLDIATPLVVGSQYAFGVHMQNRMVIGTITDIEDNMITFDFTDSSQEGRVYIALSVERLRKACTADIGTE